MTIFKKKRIFLDYASGGENPSSIHKEGRLAKKALEDARLKMARLLGVQTRDVIFTSSGTEADNLAILGVFEQARDKFSKPHIIVGQYEHPAILESAKEAERRGAELTVSDEPLKHIKENTVLVSKMLANNQTGEVNDIGKLARAIKEIRKERGTSFPYLHTDASQASLYLPVEPSRLGADLVTIDASKVYGPKGCGLLIVRPPAQLQPIIFGGEQERGLRAGTENVALIENFTLALEEAFRNRDKEVKRLNALKEFFLKELAEKFPQAKINTPEKSLPNIVSVSFPNKLHEFLAVQLDEKGVSVGTGSSCSSLKSSEEPEALRFSFGKDTSEKELKDVIRILQEVVV